MIDVNEQWFADHLNKAGIRTFRKTNHFAPQIPGFEIDIQGWSRASQLASELGMRLVALWADEEGDHRGSRLVMYMVFDHPEYQTVLARTLPPQERPGCPSIADHHVAASRMERTATDMLGVKFDGAHDDRRWIKHEHWPEAAHPLRSTFPPDQVMKRVDGDYSFLKVEGEGVYEIPVGPVHAGIIEPGHFRFSAVGERILHMEERLGYTHKGIEKRVAGREPAEAVRIISRASGDTAVGHGWAFSHACEQAAGLTPPARAIALRAILCERERMANHIGDIGAICNDVAFAFMHAQTQRLREEMARLHKRLFGHRLLFDVIVPGGMASDIDATGANLLTEQTKSLAAEVELLRQLYAEHSSIQQRVLGAGLVSVEDARSIGLLGYAGRASGQATDQRAQKRYAPYDQLDVVEPVETGGDVAARVSIRFKEIAESARLITAMLANLPEGEILTGWRAPSIGNTGFALIEGWRGEIACWVRFADKGRIGRCMVRDPSVINWLGLELAVRNVPVPDFPLSNKSFNCSYSGADL